MTREQQIIVDAVELLIQANNQFVRYHDLVSPTFQIPVIHPAEEIMCAYMEARVHFLRLSYGLNLDICPAFSTFQTRDPFSP